MITELLSEGGLSLDRLQNFCRVAEVGGVTRAAKGDVTKQSLYSRQIKELEEFFGAELMRRRGRGIALTGPGQRLHSIAREQFAALTDFKMECRGQPLEVVLGAGDSLIQWVILPKLAAIENRLPDARLKLLNLTNAEIIRRLSDGLIDFGIVRKGELGKSLGSSPLGRMGFSLFVPKNMQPAVQAARPNGLLAAVPLAVLEGDGVFRRELAALANRNKLKLKIKIECSSFPLISRAIASGRVAGVLPRMAADELQKLGVVEVPTKMLQGFEREVCLAWNPRQLQIRTMLDRARVIFAEALKDMFVDRSPTWTARGHG